jgi:hypothetical protein
MSESTLYIIGRVAVSLLLVYLFRKQWRWAITAIYRKLTHSKKEEG